MQLDSGLCTGWALAVGRAEGCGARVRWSSWPAGGHQPRRRTMGLLAAVAPDVGVAGSHWLPCVCIPCSGARGGAARLEDIKRRASLKGDGGLFVNKRRKEGVRELFCMKNWYDEPKKFAKIIFISVFSILSAIYLTSYTDAYI